MYGIGRAEGQTQETNLRSCSSSIRHLVREHASSSLNDDHLVREIKTLGEGVAAIVGFARVSREEIDEEGVGERDRQRA